MTTTELNALFERAEALGDRLDAGLKCANYDNKLYSGILVFYAGEHRCETRYEVAGTKWNMQGSVAELIEIFRKHIIPHLEKQCHRLEVALQWYAATAFANNPDVPPPTSLPVVVENDRYLETAPQPELSQYHHIFTLSVTVGDDVIKVRDRSNFNLAKIQLLTAVSARASILGMMLE